MNSTERLARALGVSVDEARRRIEAAAAYLGTTPTTVRRWINEGRVVLPSQPPAKVIPFRPREAGKGKAGRP
ncbi:MAG: hypothetical protein DIU69_04495 [Bacillota bacterium]|nr:MAG: hypothetical protein DIU69_04495 [Bacillota bacterium]